MAGQPLNALTLQNEPVGPLEPAVSWSAIIAGAVVALAVSILLTLLAAGFGMTLAPAGLGTRSSLTAFTPALGAGAIAIQVLSAGLGGYIAGRLRHQWTTAHRDEGHFRDTAQGLITWALSTVAGLILVATVLAPFAEHIAAQTAGASPLSPADVQRASNIATQAAFFSAVGMLLSAFTAAVAARLGGLESEDMHAKFLADRSE